MNSIFCTRIFAQSMMGGQTIDYKRSVGDLNLKNSQQRSFRNFEITNSTSGYSEERSTSDKNEFSAGGDGGLGQSVIYSVHVLGDVRSPGIYRLPPSARLTDAIGRAGGVLAHGSERLIQLKRSSGTKVIDLYRYTNQGHLSDNPFLADNDVIFVPIKKGEVEVEGPVNRPGNYELVKSMSLKAILDLAGGFSKGISKDDPVKIIRFDEKTEKKEIISIENHSQETYANVPIKSGDIIIFPHILNKGYNFDYTISRIPGDNIFYPTADDNVYVVGAVTTPGPLSFQPSFNSNQYVNLAGPTKDARIGKVKIIRNGKQIKYSKKMKIDPGDTLVVPTKTVTVQNFVTWAATLLSLTTSSISTYLLVKDINNR